MYLHRSLGQRQRPIPVRPPIELLADNVVNDDDYQISFTVDEEEKEKEKTSSKKLVFPVCVYI